MPDSLESTLIVTFAKSFWASREAHVFPRILFGRLYVKKMSSYFNALPLALRAFLTVWHTRPRLLFFGAAPQISPWFLSLKKYHLLPQGTKIGCQNYSRFHDDRVRYADLIVDYARATVKLRPPAARPQNKIIPLPADGDFTAAKERQLPTLLPPISQPYIFSGGGEDRDFATLIEAARSLPLNVVIITFSPQTLNYNKALPANCQVYWRLPYPDFLTVMAHSLFVVLPLKPGNHPHGQMTLVQAARLGKAVIATQQASVDEYIESQGAIGVPPGDTALLRAAIRDLYQYPGKREQQEEAARYAASRYTYNNYARELTRVFSAI